MKLTPEEIEEFRARYEKAFDVSISYDKAADMADQLVELYRIILKRPPDPPPSMLPGRYPTDTGAGTWGRQGCCLVLSTQARPSQPQGPLGFCVSSAGT